MSRYIREEMIQKPADFVDFIMADFLRKHGFTLVNINGEMVYQHGKGMITAPKYFCYRYANGIIHIEAWIKFAWLPGVYGKESDLNGYVGSVPKSAYKKDIEELIQVLYQPLPSDYQNPGGQNPYGQSPYGAQPNLNGQVYVNPTPNNVFGYGQPVQNGYGQPAQNGYGQPVQNSYGQPMQNGPITVKGVDTGNNAKIGLILVLIGIPCMIPGILGLWWCGIIFCSMGIGYCYRGMGSSKNGMAVTGFVLGIIELIVFLIRIVGYFIS